MNQIKKISETAEKKCKVAIWIITAAVLILVGMMRRPEFHITLPEGVSLDFLPMVHAIINTLVALCLIIALVSIKQGNIPRHKVFMTSAMFLSLLFLLCYVAYHFTSEETRFGGVGAIRTVYFILLITHIFFAALSLPFILLTYLAGLADRRSDHRKLAKFTFPMWLYVAVTGPICYLMLRPYY
jgi:putative membrane protein